MPPAPFRFDRTWRFGVSADRLWEAIADTGTYPAIWPWLSQFEAGPLVAGTVATFRVRPPLPYSLYFVVTIDEVVSAERVEATVGGDVRGPARLLLSPDGQRGVAARITWDLELVRPSLRRAAPVARRPMILGHDLVVALGVRQFRRKALRA